MKWLKGVLTAVLVVFLFAGLFARGFGGQDPVKDTEFLFDTLCTITTYSKSHHAAVDAAFSEAGRIHRLADFFDPQSDVSRINSAKAKVAIKVDPNIMDMLLLAREIREKSEGAFDITIAPVSTLWKFDEESPIPPTDAQIEAYLPFVGRDKLMLDADNMTVLKNFAETKIDLGGIAKGYAADKAAEILSNLGVDSAIIDFGGNIVTIGENPKTHNKKWRIGLQAPYAPTGEYSKIIETSSCAVVTSGTYQRYFEYDGTKYHHIIDPKTGRPARQDFDSVTAVSSSAALADCIATATFVLGKNQGEALAESFGADLYFLQSDSQ
ncbi:MAG: FAD:protein FMN transferase [Clostridia bacterium]|nr:FAD:protein FMN transferase [Clostridia bacterium]